VILHHDMPATSTGGSSATFDAKVYWERRLGRNPGLCGVGNTRMGRRYIEWLYRVRRVVFLRLFRSFRTNLGTAQVFDVGSGTGFYLELWRELGVASVAGCDLTEIAVSRLQSALPWTTIERMDISDPLSPLVLHRYDVVSAFDVLFHIVDGERYRQAIRNVHSLLRPGGLFVFSDLLVHGAPMASEHLACRGLEDVMALLAKMEFDVLCRVPMFVLMEEPLDSTSATYRFLWKLATYPVRRSELAGFLVGGMLYPLELFLTKIVHESPTTEIVVCRKRPTGRLADPSEDEPGDVARTH
jgi:SAM-dependent methyltransferase